MELQTYQTAVSKAGFYIPERDSDHPGFLAISGPDRISFLQRQTSGDVQKLGPGTWSFQC
jgi:folate-binding Fe-S cluster repair protein YgfZ